jgi:hypothetical protein
MASLANRVNVKPVNRRALRRYGEFWRALQLVGAAIAEAEKLAAKADTGTTKRGGTWAHWATPTPEEMKSAAKKSGRALEVMSKAAKRWEAELISREWRKH